MSRFHPPTPPHFSPHFSPHICSPLPSRLPTSLPRYIQMAVGNAPWPIGVTMVGIHERGGRDRIMSNKVAHVMNDEMMRKYITSIKRLMKYAQTKFPTDPSKMVM